MLLGRLQLVRRVLGVLSGEKTDCRTPPLLARRSADYDEAMARAPRWLAVVSLLAACGCIERQGASTCVTGDQKPCACLGGGSGGVQVCLADGTYGVCDCPVAVDMSAALDDMTPVRDLSVWPIDFTGTLGFDGSSGAKFIPDIQADIDAKSCSAAACHGSSNPPTLKAMPTQQADIDTNYIGFTANCDTGAPDQSNVLKTMLPGGGHAGGQEFASTSDPVYQRWLRWIQAGEPKQ